MVGHKQERKCKSNEDLKPEMKCAITIPDPKRTMDLQLLCGTRVQGCARHANAKNELSARSEHLSSSPLSTEFWTKGGNMQQFDTSSTVRTVT